MGERKNKKLSDDKKKLSFLDEIKEFLGDISSKQWFWICFVIFIIAQIVIHPDIIRMTYFYSEDGTIFFNGARNGISAFVTPWGGYLVTLSRLIAGMAYLVMLVTNSIIAAGETIEILSIISVALICAYFTSDSFKYIVSRRYKRIILMVSLIFLMGGFTSMFYNTVDLHWWCGIFIFFVSLNLMHGKKMSWGIMLFAIIAVLSSPSTFFIIFPCLYNLKVYGWSNQKFKIVAIIMALCVQAFFVFFVPSQLVDMGVTDTSLVMGDLQSKLRNYDLLISYLLQITFCAPFFIFGSTIYDSLMNNLYQGTVFLGGLLTVLMIMFNRKNHQVLKNYALALTAVVTIYGMIILKQDRIPSSYIFYHSTVAGIMLIFFGVQFCNSKLFSRIAVWTVPVLLTIYFSSIIRMDLRTNIFLVEIDEYVDASSNNNVRVNITPDSGMWGGRWYVDVPVEEKYFENHKCYGE